MNNTLRNRMGRIFASAAVAATLLGVLATQVRPSVSHKSVGGAHHAIQVADGSEGNGNGGKGGKGGGSNLARQV